MVTDVLIKASECLCRFLEQPQSVVEEYIGWEELARIYGLMRDWTGAAQAKIRICKLANTPYSVLSNTASWLNKLLREDYLAMDSDEKRLLYQELADLMEQKESEADATDLSRLAWLHLHLRDPERAREIVEEGLAIEADNEHCSKLLNRLRRPIGSSEELAGWVL